MSFYRFNDVITLYTPIEDGLYERHVIPAVKIQIVDCDEIKDTKVTVYIPIHGRRSLKFDPRRSRPKTDRTSFIATANQLVYLGRTLERRPPRSSLTVRKVETHLSGSRHVQHIKLLAYNIPPEEDETNE